MTHKEIKMEHVFNQFAAFHRSWHSSGANETSVASDIRESMQFTYEKKIPVCYTRQKYLPRILALILNFDKISH